MATCSVFPHPEKDRLPRQILVSCPQLSVTKAEEEAQQIIHPRTKSLPSRNTNPNENEKPVSSNGPVTSLRL